MNLKLLIFSMTMIVIGLTILYYQKGRDVREQFSEEAKVTFVIPCIGRPTIDRALQSVMAQTNPRWRAIVMYDGSKETPTVQDPRIRIVHHEKLGSAGATRNATANLVQTEWVAFLDDDDAVSPQYVDRLLEIIHSEPTVDVVVFRMRFSDSGWTLPELDSDAKLRISHVGISFAMKKEVFQEIQFKPIYAEDFYLLQDAKKAGKSIVLSEHVAYAVRPDENEMKEGKLWKIHGELKGSRHIIEDVIE